MEHLLFDSWTSVLRTLLIGLLSYAGLVVLLRVSGKRTLSKMNAFDFVVTIAIGSTLATILLDRNVPLVDRMAALGLLVLLQFVVTWSCVRINWLRRFVTGQPQLLLYRGEFLDAAMRKARITEAEVRSAIRSAGHLDVAQVGAVVLETDASFSVFGQGEDAASSALSDVRGQDRG